MFFSAVGSNNLSGSLPPELGNLLNLELIYIDSSGISGEIPSEFSNLRKVRVLDALDTPFSGKIPDFIGNWTKLTNLTLQGNSLEGPIPSSFSQLTSLESLRIGDLYTGSSTLDFVQNWENLTELILRNALVSGPIPPPITELRRLKTLFLGNNSLSGSLPDEWSPNLDNIDLSYNFLSGRLPRWVGSLSHLYVFFQILPPCYKYSKILLHASQCVWLEGEMEGVRRVEGERWRERTKSVFDTSFAIKCGGPQFKGHDGTVYEADEFVLGPAKFYVINEMWAVSKVGLFADKRGDLDLESTKAEVTGSNENPVLFQTARMTPGSLRYYGLGLVNGNYTITLHFAEIGFPNRDSETWPGLARRVFDIYIQGRLEQKDFEIAKEAGGVEKAKVKNFTVTVSENYLEIHLFWAGKGTCCIPRHGYYGPLIAALHASSDHLTHIQGDKNNNTGLIIGITVPVVVVVGLMLVLIVLYFRRKSNNEDEEGLLGIGCHNADAFSYSELQAATGDFASSNKLGDGGFGRVYKGTLSDGREVAVKQLSVGSHHANEQFVSEIVTISVVQHRNLVKLYGFCIEGNRRILVYEYLKNKSLDQALFGKNDLHLDWKTRFNICLGTARGLAYLHEESRPRIVHRDVKASNILLDEQLCPKISDFGLAKLYDDNKTHMSTRVAGTIGYLAPEYALRGHLTEKADVFGFGIVALEVVSGRPNFYTQDNEKIYLLERAWSLHENNESLDLMVDPSLADLDEREAVRLIRVALLCTQASPTMRPPMSRVVGMLAGDIDLIDTARSKPTYLSDLDFEDKTSSSRFTQNDITSSIAANPSSDFV
ncbi:putative LRR receptor-like serine/threonine-protein kinase [Morus notabilis]|uniref:non-specific serine/threonine protein kinase n=1 Tax=Morus notabilis TaxID=981085 RepID=W9RQA2_9ROSA|nr:putative LRR receptor-like serine/threonine-protein kinase [Morus notabilis]